MRHIRTFHDNNPNKCSCGRLCRSKSELIIHQRVHTKEKPLAQDVVLETLVELTKGYSGAEIAAVCNEAAIKALEEMVTCYANNLQASGDDSIKMKHFDIALSSIAPRITSESIEMYNAFKTKNH